MWDEYERALVDALYDYRNSLHKCGLPRSEVFKVNGFPKADDFAAIRFECAACEAAEREQARLASTDKALRDKGINPDSWREFRVMSLDEARALHEAQQHN